jgi:sulfate adenylyltransferase subunit 2
VNATEDPAGLRAGAQRPPSHLDQLEAESIQIIRETVAECARPVLLYSIGKDSSALLHLVRKAFFPAPPPFPMLHIDTQWKFRDMYALRDRAARAAGMDLIVHVNPEGVAAGISPIVHGAARHTEVMKTQALRQALDLHGFDAAFGGARRDEEKSRAKERVVSVRLPGHRWEPRAQRPEFGTLFNMGRAPGETLRVFPLSDWTELDVWEYVAREGIEVVPLYFAAPRPVVVRDGQWIVRDDERLPLRPGEEVQWRKVRFRSLGCFPFTGAIESEADSLEAVLAEMRTTRRSERQGRLIDFDPASSMEQKKREGYF